MVPLLDNYNLQKSFVVSPPIPESGHKIRVTTIGSKKYAILSKTPVVGSIVPMTGGLRPRVITSGDGGEPPVIITCLIHLHRFALVYGSLTDSPAIHTGTTYYGDEVSISQCGRTYDGHISIVFAPALSSIISVIELRICRNDPYKLVLETYGEIAPAVLISVWFNTGSSESPTWVSLNSVAASTVMPYHISSYTFEETIMDGVTTIACCNACSGCGCLTCGTNVFPTGTWTDNMTDPVSQMVKVFSDPTLYNFGISSNGRFTFYGVMNATASGSTLTQQIEYWVELKYDCIKMEFWSHAKFTCKSGAAAGSTNLKLSYVRNGFLATLLDVTTPDTPYDEFTSNVAYSFIDFDYPSTCIQDIVTCIEGYHTPLYKTPYTFTTVDGRLAFFAVYPELLVPGLIVEERFGSEHQNGYVTVLYIYDGSSWSMISNSASWISSPFTPANATKRTEFKKAVWCLEDRKVRFKEIGYEADIVSITELKFNNDTDKIFQVYFDNVEYTGNDTTSGLHNDRSVTVYQTEFSISGVLISGGSMVNQCVDNVLYCGPIIGQDALLLFSYEATITATPGYVFPGPDGDPATADLEFAILYGIPATSSGQPWVNGGGSHHHVLPASNSNVCYISGQFPFNMSHKNNDNPYPSQGVKSNVRVVITMYGDYPPGVAMSAEFGAWNLEVVDSANAPYDATKIVPGGIFKHTIETYIIDKIAEFAATAITGCKLDSAMLITAKVAALRNSAEIGSTIEFTNGTYDFTAEVDAIGDTGIVTILRSSIAGPTEIDVQRNAQGDQIVIEGSSPSEINTNVIYFSGDGAINEYIKITKTITFIIYYSEFVGGVWSDWILHNGSNDPLGGTMRLYLGGTWTLKPVTSPTGTYTFSEVWTTHSSGSLGTRVYVYDYARLYSGNGTYARKYKMVITYTIFTLQYNADLTTVQNGDFTILTAETVFTVTIPQ